MVYIEDGLTFAHKILLHQLSSGFTPAQRKTCTITSCIVQVLQCCLIFGTSVTIGQNQLSSAFTPAQRNLYYFQLYTARFTMLPDIWHVYLGCLDGGTCDCGPLDGWSCTNSWRTITLSNDIRYGQILIRWVLSPAQNPWNFRVQNLLWVANWGKTLVKYNLYGLHISLSPGVETCTFHKVIVFIHCECDVCYKHLIGGPFSIQDLSISYSLSCAIECI